MRIHKLEWYWHNRWNTNNRVTKQIIGIHPSLNQTVCTTVRIADVNPETWLLIYRTSPTILPHHKLSIINPLCNSFQDPLTSKKWHYFLIKILPVKRFRIHAFTRKLYWNVSLCLANFPVSKVQMGPRYHWSCSYSRLEKTNKKKKKKKTKVAIS